MPKNEALEKYFEKMGFRDANEIKTYTTLDSDRLRYEGHSPANKAFDEHRPYRGIQCTMDKFRKIYGWRVHHTEWHPETKSFDVTLMENTKIKEVKHVSYEEICKTLRWHSFEIVGPDTIKPDPLTYEEIEAIDGAHAIKVKPEVVEEDANKKDEEPKLVWKLRM